MQCLRPDHGHDVWHERAKQKKQALIPMLLPIPGEAPGANISLTQNNAHHIYFYTCVEKAMSDQARVSGISMSFLIGLTAGVFGGLVGLGGGVVMIPLLVGLRKLGQHKAHGASLVALIFTGAIGGLTYALHGAVDVPAAMILAAAALLPVRWGAKYSCEVPEIALQRVFGVFLIMVSLLLLLKPYLPQFAHLDSGAPRVLVLLAAGAVTGFVAGLLGLGGGAVMITAMVLLAGFDQHTAQGTSLLAMVPIGIVGAWTHWQRGYVGKDILRGLITGIVLGTFAGAWFAHFLVESGLRILFSAVLIWTGLRFTFKQATR